jgi:two-component system CheB/CheR fusion protein
MPYRTFDDRIDGLVITFIDISDSKRAEEKLNETLQGYSLFLNSSTDVIVKLSSEWKIQEFNLAAEKLFGKKRGDVVNQSYIELFIPESLRKKTQKELTKLLEQAKNNKIIMQVISTGDNSMEIEWLVNVLFNNLQKPSGMIITKKID